MAFNYPAMATTSQRLLASFGRNVEIIRYVGGTTSLTAGTKTGGADRKATIKAAILPATSSNLSGANEQYKEELIKGSIRFVIAEAKNAPWVPESGDRLKFDNEEWIVFGNTPINPAGTNVIHKMGIRRK